jgi:aspartate/tyrosine/aromatic aminotransferase
MVLTNGLKPILKKIQGNEIKLLHKVIHFSTGFKMGEKNVNQIALLREKM